MNLIKKVKTTLTNGVAMKFIDDFEAHYNYDCTYLRRLAEMAPEAFDTFVGFMPMGKVGASLSPDMLWTAKIAAMLTEDCGACVQLNIDMALEAGVEGELIKKIIENPEGLDEDLRVIHKFSQAVARNYDDHHKWQQAAAQILSPLQLGELAVAISSTKIYPTIKRALGEFKSCQLYSLKY